MESKTGFFRGSVDVKAPKEHFKKGDISNKFPLYKVYMGLIIQGPPPSQEYRHFPYELGTTIEGKFFATNGEGCWRQGVGPCHMTFCVMYHWEPKTWNFLPILGPKSFIFPWFLGSKGIKIDTPPRTKGTSDEMVVERMYRIWW